MKLKEVTLEEFLAKKTEFVLQAQPVKIKNAYPQMGSNLLDNLCEELAANAKQSQIHYLTCGSETAGRYFYNEQLNGFNFTVASSSLAQFFSLLNAQSSKPNKQYYAAQAIPVEAVFSKQVMSEICHPVLANNADVRMWIGNQCNTAAHFDFSENVAIVLAGRRKFTLFPPETIGDLYVGPINCTPGGTPISLVDVSAPDLQRFPRYANALEHAIEVDVDSGEGIYIPNLWWHSVQSLSDINILINYWWKQESTRQDKPFESMLYLMSFMPSLPLEQRKAWQSFFNHFVFRTEDSSLAHLPTDLHDLSANITEEDREKVREWFKSLI
ncbi:cupin-like domain-containing protein [Pseudoalteromonas byunsanensis]|uniref:JmjC domain-containing protein n=1 Tax=Pseudoalteromonas byunsanensis TaxID=327939 RepID=A0A1S1N4E7_9GAMM|nr:cupin-like domain-containing protein [Pseudoalteromonas byunsanensis]OHU94856.1 hypothetical protein BIW53_12600 [Pseudoalteromonas byunsanensis]